MISCHNASKKIASAKSSSKDKTFFSSRESSSVKKYWTKKYSAGLIWLVAFSVESVFEPRYFFWVKKSFLFGLIDFAGTLFIKEISCSSSLDVKKSSDSFFIEKFNDLKSMLETEDVDSMRKMMRHSTERRALFDKK